MVIIGVPTELIQFIEFLRAFALQESVWAEAAAMAAERRGNLEGPGVSLQKEWEGILLWETPPEAGREAVLLYNRDSGALRCVPPPPSFHLILSIAL